MKSLFLILFAIALGVLTACDSQSSSKKSPPPLAPPNEAGAAEDPGPTVDRPAEAPVEESVAETESDSETPPGGEGASAGETNVPPSSDLKSGLSVTRAVLLRDIGNGIARKAIAFGLGVDELRLAANSYCAQRSPETKAIAQAAWRKVILAWEEFELFQIGPVAANAKALKIAIYGWPQAANLCMIDSAAIDALENPAFALPSASNRKGLQAIEYLLYESKLASACSRTNPITTRWDALSAEKKEEARCAYLLPVIQELQANAAKLANDWGAVDDNYLTRGIGNPEAEQAAIQDLFENLFYLDVEFKNQKLAAPAGHEKKYCAKTPAACPDKEELRLSRLSREAMEANIQAFTDLMFGFADTSSERHGGFAALVRDRGSDSLALRSEDYAKTLHKIFGESQASLPALITEQAQENCDLTQNSMLCKLRSLLKQIAADLKSEYTQILGVKVPVAPAGDND